MTRLIFAKRFVGMACSKEQALSELLGDHHDLAVLHDTLSAQARAFGEQAELTSFTELIASTVLLPFVY